jgi:hypothetical protein
MLNHKTAQLLISGGDDRLALNENGVNKYGCSPTPDDEILAFSSSTASPISSQNFAIANNLRIRLEQANFSEQIHTHEIMRQKAEWLELLGFSTDTQLIFSPSGTDLHCLVSKHVANNTLIIMVEGNETGSGVAAALNRGQDVEVVAISLRFANGLPRSISDIDDEVATQVQKGIEQDQNVLLILADQSKTGMIAPSPKCAIQLKNQYKTRLNVLIDACQFRLSRTTLNAYLKQGFMMALTGSKFLAAPSFSAMLILPPSIKFLLESEKINFGLLLRMEMALYEYRAFCALTDAKISAVIQNFANTVQNYLNASVHFEPLETPVLNRDGLVKNTEWDSLPTIFPFVLLRDKRPLSQTETLAIYQQLPLQNPRCQIGQPVICGNEKSALRLCLSAPMIVQAAQSERNHQICIEKAMRVLKTLELVLQNSDR